MKILVSILALFMCSVAHAELKYEQSFTLSNFISFEESKKEVGAFAIAAKGNPNILIMGVKYDKTGKEPCIMYNATITCYVSEPDTVIETVKASADILRYNIALDLIEGNKNK